MSELIFKKGLEKSLPLNRDSNTFYITTDGKKMFLGNSVWEDTNNVKSEIIGIIKDNERTISESLIDLNNELSYLNENVTKINNLANTAYNISSVNTYSIESLTNDLNEQKEEFNKIIIDNERAISESLIELKNQCVTNTEQIDLLNSKISDTNESTDEALNKIETLTNKIDNNEIVISRTITQLEESKASTEYVDNAISSLTSNFEKIITDNEMVIAESLIDLKNSFYTKDEVEKIIVNIVSEMLK